MSSALPADAMEKLYQGRVALSGEKVMFAFVEARVRLEKLLPSV